MDAWNQQIVDVSTLFANRVKFYKFWTIYRTSYFLSLYQFVHQMLKPISPYTNKKKYMYTIKNLQ